MDNSETYIKMCEKAVEIQADRPFPSTQVVDEKLVDDWEMTYFDEGYLIDNRGNWWADTHPDTTWLPRQDQLQEMMKCKYPVLKELLYRFSLWALFYTRKYTSMEQIWFAFIMISSHNKVWNGCDWISSN
ncbi:hypothetical protein LCGC14_0408710 [marine sediment metagenome]|uniref:Uncharacterized protein n=1 Tax=marine sediment metagenome TaxID=412755 RepID=A0A0F9T059_9ZZZZ